MEHQSPAGPFHLLVLAAAFKIPLSIRPEIDGTCYA